MKSSSLSPVDVLNCKLEIQDSMIRSFSKEFYENIGQILSLAKIQLGTVDPIIGEKEQVKQQLQSTSLLIEKAIGDLRKIIRQNNPDIVLENGLLTEISREVDHINASGYGRINFNMSGKMYRLNPDRELILFCALKCLITDFSYNDAFPLDMQISYRESGILIRMDKRLKGNTVKNFSLPENVLKKIRSVQGSIHGMYINEFYKLSIYIRRYND